MIHAHVFETQRIADYWWQKSILIEKEVIKASRNPMRMIELKNGDVHYFMAEETYQKWSIGRTYIIADELHHSDSLVEREGE